MFKVGVSRVFIIVARLSDHKLLIDRTCIRIDRLYFFHVSILIVTFSLNIRKRVGIVAYVNMIHVRT